MAFVTRGTGGAAFISKSTGSTPLLTCNRNDNTSLVRDYITFNVGGSDCGIIQGRSTPKEIISYIVTGKQIGRAHV